MIALFRGPEAVNSILKTKTETNQGGQPRRFAPGGSAAFVFIYASINVQFELRKKNRVLIVRTSNAGFGETKLTKHSARSLIASISTLEVTIMVDCDIQLPISYRTQNLSSLKSM